MSLEKLDNLVKINQLKVEPPDQKESKKGPDTFFCIYARRLIGCIRDVFEFVLLERRPRHDSHHLQNNLWERRPRRDFHYFKNTL